MSCGRPDGLTPRWTFTPSGAWLGLPWAVTTTLLGGRIPPGGGLEGAGVVGAGVVGGVVGAMEGAGVVGDMDLRNLQKATQLDRLFGPAWLAYGHSFAVENEHDQAMAAYFKVIILILTKVPKK